jgi:selenide,water dikinase
VHACTDITGFGLIGHATEMADASQAAVVIQSSAVPVFDGVLEIVETNRSGGLVSNQDHFSAAVEVSQSVRGELQDVFYDPQTSGGLLVAVDAAQAESALHALSAAHVTAWRVGHVTTRVGATITIT